jgi:hypothetical protein
MKVPPPPHPEVRQCRTRRATARPAFRLAKKTEAGEMAVPMVEMLLK